MTHPTPDLDELEVTQADRDAAASLVEWQQRTVREWEGGWQFFASSFADGIRKGIWDDHNVVQAFARHRIASARREQALREALELRRAKSYADWQQRRGRAADLIDWAVAEFDEWMLDDHYDTRAVLDRIIERLRQFQNDARAALADSGCGEVTPHDQDFCGWVEG